MCTVDRGPLHASALMPFVFLAAGIIALAMGTAMCTPAERMVVRTVVDLLLATCVEEQQGKTEDAVVRACNVAEADLPIVRRLMGARERGYAAMARDGGR